MSGKAIGYRVFAGFVTLRVLYAAIMLLSAYLERLGLDHPMSSQGHFIVLVTGLNPVLLLLWTAYVVSYGVGAAAIWYRSKLALYAYLVGAAIDFGLWSYSSFSQNYQATFGGRAASIDMLFNLIDLSIIAVLLLLWNSKRLR